MNSRVTPVALPSGPVAPATPDGKPAARPLAGPVVPLTVTPGTGNSEELLGGAGNSSPHGDAIATRVLVKGEPVPAPRGRADDFVLQPGNAAAAISPAPVIPSDALASAPATPANVAPAEPPVAPQNKPAAPPKNNAAGKTTQNAAAKPKSLQPPPPRDDAPRPPRPVSRSGGNPFGSWFR
jgi:uncharacterized protein